MFSTSLAHELRGFAGLNGDHPEEQWLQNRIVRGRVLQEGHFDDCDDLSPTETRALVRCVEESPLGSGAYGIVTAVRFDAGHVRYRSPEDTRNSQSIVLARKTFFGGEAEARNNYLNEVRFDELLRGTLNSSEEIHENIMTAFCGYGNMVDSKATWSIFYHRAQCSLTEYLANDNYFPITSRGRLEHIYQMLCIANALKWMADRTHDGVQGPVELGYYHCDLKPSNILVFITEGDPSKLTFKVSDFGRAVPSSNASGPGRSMNRSSTVPVEAIDSMCSAPEMSGKIPVVGSRSDVWSFGCILLLVLVFNAHGMAAVAEFTSSLLRTAATDSFWEPRHKSFGRTADIVVKAEVSNCIEQLRNLTRDNTDWVVVDGLLTLLEKEILITNRKKRARLDRLIAQMAERYNSRYQVTPKEEKRNRQAQYLLCAQSPRGEFELFHEKGDRRTLFIWRFGWTGPLHELRPMSPPKDSENILPQLNPHSDSCASEKICQVVSNRDPFEVLIYTIPISPRTRVIRDFIALSGFKYAESIAISPDGSSLAIDTIESINKHKRRRRLWLFDVGTLLGQMPRIRSLPSTIPDELSPTALKADYYDKLRDHSSSVRDIDQETRYLRFRGAERLILYHGVRYKVRGRRRFDVSGWDVDKSVLLKRHTIEDKNIEHENWVTGFATFNSKLGFAVIIHRETIELYNLNSDTGTRVTWINEPKPRDLKVILITFDDTWAIVIWGGSRLNVSGFPLPFSAGREKVLKIDKADNYAFDTERDRACITVGENNERFLLITYCSGRSAKFNLEPFFFPEESERPS